MKVLGQMTLSILMLTLLAACGKDNKSGGSSNNGYTNSLCASTYNCSMDSLTGLDTRYNGVTLQTVLQQNTCLSGTASRMQYTQTVTLPYVVQSRDVYVGVTSFGDVAAVIGRGTNTATFVAYLCPRSSMYGSVSQPVSAPTNVSLGVATRCRFKTMFAANLAFNDGTYALFRYLDGGTSTGTAFSICQ